MKLKDLANIIKSDRGIIQMCTLYDDSWYSTGIDLADGCSIEYAMVHYGEYDIIKLNSYENKLLIKLSII